MKTKSGHISNFLPEKFSKIIKNKTAKFFELSIEEKLKFIDQRTKSLSLNSDNDSAAGRLCELVTNTTRDLLSALQNDESNGLKRHLDDMLAHYMDQCMQLTLDRYFQFLLIQSLFSPNMFNEEYIEWRKDKVNLNSPGRFREALMKILEPMYLEEVRQGGRDPYWTDRRKVEFLAAYTRYLLVIKNARKDFRAGRKKQQSTIDELKSAILRNYEIPADFGGEVFEPVTPASDAAIAWAKRTLKLDDSKSRGLDDAYLKKILGKARSLYLGKQNSYLIGVNYSGPLNPWHYTIGKNAKERISQLKFTPPSGPVVW
jgi:hypothetical protein